MNNPSPSKRSRKSKGIMALAATGALALAISAFASQSAMATCDKKPTGEPAQLVTVLGSDVKNDSANSETRIDFVVKVPTGDTIKKIYYLGEFNKKDSWREAHKLESAAKLMKNWDDKYVIQERASEGGYDYLGITLTGDSTWEWKIDVPCGQTVNTEQTVKIKTEKGGEMTFTTPIELYRWGFDCKVDQKPIVAIPWDNWWKSTKDSSQDGFGVNVGTTNPTEVTPGVVGTGRFIINVANMNKDVLKKGKGGVGCSLTVGAAYEWVDAANNPVVVNGVKGPQYINIAPITKSAQAPLKDYPSAVENGADMKLSDKMGKTGVPSNFPATFDFRQAGSGYYKLLVWPTNTMTESFFNANTVNGKYPTTGFQGITDPACASLNSTPGDIASAWQVGSVWNGAVSGNGGSTPEPTCTGCECATTSPTPGCGTTTPPTTPTCGTSTGCGTTTPPATSTPTPTKTTCSACGGGCAKDYLSQILSKLGMVVCK